MGPISLPAGGLSLAGVSGSSDRDDFSSVDSQPPQVMRLDLADGVLDEIIRASQHGKNIHLAFGKTIVRPLVLLLNDECQ